jgi:hypothetical protein
MKARHALLLAGSLWEIVRFFLVISLIAALLHAAVGAGPWVLPWLLLGGSGNLVVAAGGIMLSLFPDKHDGVIGLLRVGKILGIFSFLLLLASGALREGAGVTLFSFGRLVVTQGPVLFALFVFDLLFLAILLAWRRGDDARPIAPRGADTLPEYSETEVKDYH